MTEKERERTCENCGDEPATILCPECPKCYCDGCSEFTHKKAPKKDHKTECIPKGVDVKATCPRHKGNPLELLCLDEVKLCCPMCVVVDFHKDHKVVKIEDIKQDNETFSATEVRKDFEDILERSTTLDRKIDEVTEIINKEMEETKEKIEIFFDEERQKLNDEEKKLINELEEARTKAIGRLDDFKAIIEDANEYSTALSKAANTLKMNDSDNEKKECSRLMELNIVGEMKEQRRKIERLLGTEMRDLKISWDREARKLSFTRNLFSGVPSVRNVAAKAVSWGEMDVSWEIDGDEKSEEDEIRYTVEMRKEGEEDWKEAKSVLTDQKCKVRGLMGNSAYEVRMRCVAKGGSLVSAWSSVVKGRTLKAPEFSECAWKECPDYVIDNRKYGIYKKNLRVATNIGDDYMYCTIIGNTHIPLNTVTSWSIKVHKSMNNNGHNIYIGTAPNDINQNDANHLKCGWYFNCYWSELWSGPPHNYRVKAYGPWKRYGQYVHTGDSVGVVMDTTKGDLLFVPNGVNLGVAYEGIPLDKPLVPCVLLWCQGDSVELDLSDVKENVDSSIPIPSNITTKSITWDLTTLTWDEVVDASLYQVEVDGSKLCDVIKTNSFTKRGLLPETEHSFRVRTVRGNSVSEWSGVVKGRTPKVAFETSWWKECPGGVDENKRYSVDARNPRIATKGDDGWCTIIGNTYIPLNKVTLWSIKVLKSKYNNGYGIYIGVAPFDINQNSYYNDCGWYFNCYWSELRSGPPHNYDWPGKEYGPRKAWGQYVHTGDSVGVVVDTTRGDLSFVPNGVNHGVAFEGIPLDKPLVPCVLLWYKGDSVELDTSEVKENADSSVPIPSNITAKSITWGSITLTWDEVRDASFYQVEVDGSKLCDATTTNSFTKGGLLPETEHSFRVRTVRGSSVSEWSGVVKGRTTKVAFETSWWKECPGGVDENKRYSVDARNPRIATKGDDGWCTIIGNTYIPLNKVTLWSIKVLKSKYNNGYGIYIGVAPFDINQNSYYNECGWYFDCYDSSLCSGPPHKYSYKEYGPRKLYGEYVHAGDSVGVVVDTTRGDLSFVPNGVNLGVAYEGIPLDKPLVSCVLLWYKGDSVELDTSEVKENADSSISVPSNITAKSSTWDSITLTWDEVVDTSFYQIEVDGSKLCDVTTTNPFTKRGLLPDTNHSFRVRTVRGNSVSEWSGVVKGRTLKAPEFPECVWKKCPDDVDEDRKYSVDGGNPRIATKAKDYGLCTIIGNTYIPLNKVTSWNIKVRKSKEKNGDGICIGIAPNDINQNDDVNYNKCGWYFDCCWSTLRSGPPHNYRDKKYGPRKGYGQYVHTGDSVGVVMDTERGELSFVLNGVNLGVAYCGIPLDKPLVPCVLLWYKGDSVELDTSEVKENEVDSSVPTPSNITAKSTTWDTITLTWDEVSDVSFYQIEVDGSNSWDATTTNTFTKRGLLPDTEHSFRIRAVRVSSVSEWSGVVKGRTLKAPEFSECVWKECSGYVDNERKYSVSWNNPRVATKVNYGSICWCTVIGNTHIPLNTVTSWNIKVHKSRDNNGASIHIGIAPFDIDQSDDVNFDRCGWYFYCYWSDLRSGPPHNYNGKPYGPRKEKGQYVHTGDSVGVVVDTTRGDLSFVLNGVNFGVAYAGIPLDKPLVPCVLLGYPGDSVKLDTPEVKENVVDISISVPSSITAKSITWDSITLAWDEVSDASFYRIEVDGSKLWDASTTNTFTKRELLPETEHSFRVRTVRGSSVSEWSVVVKGRTTKVAFETSGWKECPGNIVDKGRKYSVDGGNLRIATKINDDDYDGWCTIIGNTHIALNTVTSWSVKILKSKNNNGNSIYVGIAPFDINQKVDNYDKCGWYFDCYYSVLCSGPPHKYRWPGKEYGPRKENGRYVHTGDSVGVVMDTTRGDLSFVLNGVNHGVAFEGIPLDKPLVPCVLLWYKGDSVELDTPELKENVDSSVPVPSNITAKSITWGSITLTWDEVSDASFYQVEVDGSKSWDATTANTFTLRGLLPETKHSFRVRTVRGNSVSEWSSVVKGRTTKVAFETSGWKECPGGVDENKKYSVDGRNPKVATKVNVDWFSNDWCTIIGNTPIPLNKVTLWSIKVLKSNRNGHGICIGVTPNDIDQNNDYNNCDYGWYFNCYKSILHSGLPHNYRDKEYGPRKGIGQYVHAGDSIGVVVDTIKGDLSFVPNRVNLGVAYEGIPLDKPLVPCVILRNYGDSVEFDTSEVKENEVDSSIPVPSNIVANSTTWDSITLSWNEVANVSFYQVEVNRRISWDVIKTNSFTKRGLFSETEHSFRVRAVRESSVSEWSDVVKGRTLKAPEFSECVWKKCPDYVDDNRKYSVDEGNLRVAIKVKDGYGYSTIIGNTQIPPNTVTSWSIEILEPENNNGNDIFIGIAQNDINQNNDYNNSYYGWYFNCYYSELHSGLPHNYRDKEYGPRKRNGRYVHTGDNVGVVVDTTKGELSFTLNNVNLGVAYEGIPLDKPLAPCVILGCEGDSVELVI